jgi:hypothetical protein
MTTGPKYHTKEADQHKKKIKEAKHVKENEHCLNQTSISNRYTALLEERSEDQQQKEGPVDTPKPPPIYITDDTNTSPLIQLLEQIAKQQYEVKVLADNQVNVQPKTSESYRTNTKALPGKCIEFNTYKLKANRSYRVVLQNISSSGLNINLNKPNLADDMSDRMKESLRVFSDCMHTYVGHTIWL